MIKIILKVIGVFVLIIALFVGGVALTLEAKLPTSTLDMQPLSQTPTTNDSTSLLIFGATRNTGLMVARLFKARGDKVTAFVRSTSNTADLETIDVDMVVGDAMDIETVRAAFATRNYAAVLTTVGCLACNPSPDYQANANIIAVAKEAGVQRVVLVTMIGAGNSYTAIPALSTRIMAKIIPLKTQAEDELRASGLDYTIIRPGGLRSGGRTGNGVLSEDLNAFGHIYREDLSELLVAVLDDRSMIGKTLAAVDPNRRYPWDSK